MRRSSLLERVTAPGPGSALLLFLLAAALFYAPVLLGFRTFDAGDFTDHFLPFSLFHQQQIRGLDLPVWNPYTYSGHPFLADIQAAVYYLPNNLLLALTLPWQSAASRLYFLQVEAVLHVALAGWFVYLLAAELTRSRQGGLIAGLLFALSGYLAGYPPLQLAVLRSAIWLPLALWCLHRGFARPGEWRWWIGAGAATALILLGGHAQTFLHASYALAAYSLFLLLRGADSRRFSQLLGLLASALVAAGLVAAQALPSWEFTQLSVRAVADYAFVSGGFPLQDAWQILLPGVLTQYSPLYVGAAGLACWWAALAATVTRGLDEQSAQLKAGILFFAGLALVAFLLSLGDSGFLFPVFYRFAPGWSLFRGQERAAYLVTFGMAMLGGYGAALLPALPQWVRRRAALTFGAGVTVGVYVFGLGWQLLGRAAITEWRYLLIAALTLVFGLGSALLLWLPGWSARRAALLVGLVALNLFWANLGVNTRWGTPGSAVERSPELQAIADAAQGDAQIDDPPGRVYNEYRVFDDYGMVLGVEDVWGSSPLRLQRYADLFDAFPLDRMWRLLGVRHVVTWRRELFGPSELLGEFPQASDTTYLHRLPEAHSRAWLVSEIRSVSDDEAVALLADHQIDLDAVGLLPEDAIGQGQTIAGGDYIVNLERPAADAWRIDITSDSGGLLVIAENWMPGWTVREVVCGSDDVCAAAPFNGATPFAVLRANHTLLGVVVPPGEARFELAYRPTSVVYGLWISGATLLALAAAASIRWYRKRKR